MENPGVRPLFLHFGEFEAFQVFFFQDCPGFFLVLFYCLLESVPECNWGRDRAGAHAALGGEFPTRTFLVCAAGS